MANMDKPIGHCGIGVLDRLGGGYHHCGNGGGGGIYLVMGGGSRYPRGQGVEYIGLSARVAHRLGGEVTTASGENVGGAIEVVF